MSFVSNSEMSCQNFHLAKIENQVASGRFSKFNARHNILHYTVVVHYGKLPCPPHLWQLLGDPTKDMVVELPSLGQVLDVVATLVLPTPVVRLGQIQPVCLQGKSHKHDNSNT